MVSLNAEISTDLKTVTVTAGDDALPGEGVSLGSFFHNQGDDPLGSHPGNHTVFHHVASILHKTSRLDPTQPATFPDNIHDIASIQIIKSGPILTAESITGEDVTVAVGADAPVPLLYQPGDIPVVPEDVIWNILDETVAVFNASGVVTGVTEGATWIHAVNMFNDMATDVLLTVTPAVGLLAAPDTKEEADKTQAIIDTNKTHPTPEEAEKAREIKKIEKADEVTNLEDDDHEEIDEPDPEDETKTRKVRKSKKSHK